MVKLLNVLLLLLMTIIGTAQSTPPTDKNFGKNGALFLNLYDYGLSLDFIDQDIDAAGNLFVLASGRDDSYLPSGYAWLLKLNASGKLDSTFFENGFRNIGTPAMYPQFVRVSRDQSAIYVFQQSQVVRFKQNGQLDSSFANNGVLDGAFHNVTDVVLLPDNSFLEINCFNGISPTAFKIELMKFTEKGIKDSSFNTTGTFTLNKDGKYYYSSTLWMQNGDIILSGSTPDSVFYREENIALIKIKKSGQLDSAYGNAGIAKNTQYSIILRDYVYVSSAGRTVLLPDSSILVAEVQLGNGRFNLFKFTKNGGVDSTFGVNGFETTDYFRNKVASLLGKPRNPSNRYFWFSPRPDASMQHTICNFKADGHLDSSAVRKSLSLDFLNDNQFTQFGVTSIITDSQLVSASLFSTTGQVTNYYNSVLRAGKMNTNGSMDSTYGVNGKTFAQITASTDRLVSMIPLKDNKIAGLAFSGDPKIFRLNADGSRDSSFGKNGVTALEPFCCSQELLLLTNGHLAVDNSNRLVTAFKKYTDSRIVIYRFTAKGQPDSSFGAGGQITLPYSQLEKIVVQKDDKILLLMNTYLTRDRETDITVLRINNTGKIDSSFGVNGFRNVDLAADFFDQTPPLGTASDQADNMILLKDGNILVAGSTVDIVDSYLFKLNKNGQIIRTGGVFGRIQNIGNEETRTNFMAEDDSGRIVFSQDYYYNSEFRSTRVARLKKDLSWDESYRAAALPAISKLELNIFASGQLLNNGELYLGGVQTNTGKREPVVLCIKPNGGIDSSKGQNGLLRFNNFLPAFSTLPNPDNFLFNNRRTAVFRDSAGQLVTATTAIRNQLSDVFITRNLVNDIPAKPDTTKPDTTNVPLTGKLTVWAGKICTGASSVVVKMNNTTDSLSAGLSAAPACGSAAGTLTYNLQPGNYQLRAYCGKDSVSYDLSVSAGSCTVKEIAIIEGNRSLPTQNSGIRLQPNPAYETCNVYLESNDTGILRIMNLNGMEVLQQRFNGQNIQVDISRLTAGTYLVDISGNKYQARKLLLKLR